VDTNRAWKRQPTQPTFIAQHDVCTHGQVDDDRRENHEYSVSHQDG
jgi:hypothetical protein